MQLYKVHSLISSYENLLSRLQQVVKLAAEIDNLTAKVEEFNRKVGKFSSDAANTKQLKDISDGILKLKNSFANKLSRKLETIEQQVAEVLDAVSWLRHSVEMRLRDDHNGCKWLGRDGYCTMWCWHGRQRGGL